MDKIILLDLDGVLITSAPWKSDTIHEDGYSDFDHDCVIKLNSIIEKTGYDIVLSSARRTVVNINKMNEYFKARGISKSIIDYIPNYNIIGERIKYNRKEEIELYLEYHKPINYLIIDDDKSLSELKDKSKWIKTYMMKGLKDYDEKYLLV